jgi:hypothetical protein
MLPSGRAIWFVTWAKHNNLFAACVREGVWRSLRHLDRRNALSAATDDGRWRLTKGRVGGPGAAGSTEIR